MAADDDPKMRGQRAESIVANAFRHAGWAVENEPPHQHRRPDLIVHRDGVVYAVEVKAASEGRGDRLVPLFAQAVLQSSQFASPKAAPLAIVAAPKIPATVVNQVLKFAADYAPNVALGVIDFEGLRLFRGHSLDLLNAPPPPLPSHAQRSKHSAVNLFSDLNQWMLKVLLAPELPEALLGAPRAQYRNASQLAQAADVSVMSAFRLVQQLRDEGFLHESHSSLHLVRRGELLRRWQAAAVRPLKELPMRFLLGGHGPANVQKMFGSHRRVCLALFAAADALKLGFVEGVSPHVYVDRIGPSHLAAWKHLRPCEPGEPADVILRQAAFPKSIFRGLVHVDGVAVCDVLQVWLDVLGHPSRGKEQADHIRKRVLAALIGERR